ncbi:hypothetical protein [Microbacterium sp. 4NA327F11]|uniref:hypothetical protein n=1 Tax=Microbacterium sp. 4NA327F11 TaxID=2502229 RepID=UPI0010F9609F|nr:hypothetical protein [Microbacterium sp. 4NA327F11]
MGAPPMPVDPFPDVPSRVTSTWHTSAGDIGNDVMNDMFRLLAKKPAGTVAPPIDPVNPPKFPTAEEAVKQITGPQHVSRAPVAGGAGGVINGLYVGWALGVGGLQLYTMATGGTSVDDLLCQNPVDWYNGLTMSATYGLAGDCKARVTTPNADQVATTQAVYGSATVTLKGTAVWNSSSGDTTSCWTATYPFPTGYSIIFPNTIGTGGTTATSVDPAKRGITLNLRCSSFPTANAWVSNQSAAGGTQYLAPRIVANSTGTAVATATTSTPDPNRSLSCRIKWADGTTTTGAGSTYKESTGLPMSAASTGCTTAWDAKPGAGTTTMPQEIGINSQPDGGAKTEISTGTVPSYSPDQQKGLTATSTGGGLILRKTINNVTDSCMTWAANCSGWWSATSNGTTTGTGTGSDAKYDCSFGGASIALAECGIYRSTFDTQTDTPTITVPETGVTVPISAGQTAQNTTSPAAGPTPGEACMNEWGSAPNPIEWVMTPVKCALVWAFVPRTDVSEAQWGAVRDAWDETIVGRLPALVQSTFIPPSGGSGCMGPHIVFAYGWAGHTFNVDMYPLQACSAPMSTVASLARTIGAAVLIFMTALGIIRRISAIVNAPGVGGGDS